MPETLLSSLEIDEIASKPEVSKPEVDSPPGNALARKLTLLQEVGRDITSILDRDRLLERIADAVARLIDYQLFALFEWREDAQCLESVYVRRDDARSPVGRSVLAPGEGLCGLAAELRRPVRAGDVRAESRFVDCGDPEVRSAIALPILFEDRLLGVLDLESHEADFFDARDEQFLEILVSSIAVALENANLYERLRADERRLADDLATAREVQRYLLPRETPWVPGVQLGVVMCPARELGGDLYDFYRYPDGRLAVAVGDIAGKGAGAALLGTLALGILRGWAKDASGDPVRALAHLDEELRGVELPRRFLAMTYAVIDPDRRVLTLANAGLPYALVARASGAFEEIELGGLPLGTLHQAPRRIERRQVEIALEPGDLVIFTTDGVVEAVDAAGRPFGVEGVIEALRDVDRSCGRCVADAVVAAADRHRGDREPGDDRTVVALRLAG